MSAEPEILDRDLFGEVVRPDKRGPLSERFLMPPFSVLSARDGAWQERKRAWLSIGLKGEELGREGDLTWNIDTSGRSRQSDGSLKDGRNGFDSVKESARTERPVTGDNCTSGKNSAMLEGEGATTSIFDPVICELMYRWFCPIGGTKLDPFAGGSVRGIVAAYMGRQY